MKSLGKLWPIIALFVLVIGGIYGGLFTATEAGALGAAGVAISVLKSSLPLRLCEMRCRSRNNVRLDYVHDYRGLIFPVFYDCQ